MTDTSTTAVNKKKSLPASLWVLALADGLFCGLIPLVTIVMLYQNPESKLTTVDLTVMVLLCGGIIATAIGVISRDNHSRYILLALITIYWSLRLFNSLGMIRADNVTESNFGLVYGNLWRAIFWIGLNWWYWLKRSTSEFYRAERSFEV